MLNIFLSFCNELAIGDDGYAQIAPLGDFPGVVVEKVDGVIKRSPAIQRIDKVAVAQMVNEYRNSMKGLTRYKKARPLYLGHPDMLGCEHKYPDKEKKGVFANLAEREDGLYGEVILTEEGESIITSGKARSLSGRWSVEYVGTENGQKIFRPTRFLSAGLTNAPNLPVQLMNEAEEQEKDKEMKSKLLAMLARLKLSTVPTFSNETSDDDVVKGLETALTASATIANEKATLTTEKATLANEKATLDGKVTTLTTQVSALTTERDTARTQFANERKAHIGHALDSAITSGKITAADRPTWEGRLNVEANFANELESLNKIQPGVKTKSVTVERNGVKVEITNASQRNQMVQQIVRENQKSGLSYNEAYKKAQVDHPALFAAMAQPEIKANW